MSSMVGQLRPPQDEDNDGTLEFSKEFFYSTGADTTVRLKDGKILKFNRGALIANSRSRILYQVFCGSLRDEDVTDIPDIEYDKFKLFLDCSMGYRPINFSTAYFIFPVVWKYQIPNLIEQCIIALRPNIMDPKVFLIHHLAASSDCNTLKEQTEDFIKKNLNPYKFMDQYWKFFELIPHYLEQMLSEITPDSAVLIILKTWGILLMKKKNYEGTLKAFMEKYGYLKYFQLDCFETTGALTQFCLCEHGRNIFSTDEILTHIQNSKDLMHCESKWMRITKQKTFTEVIILPPIPSKLRIEKNKIVVYEPPQPQNTIIFSCQAHLIGQDNAGNAYLNVHRKIDFRYQNIDTKPFHLVCRPFDQHVNLITKCVLKLKWTFFVDCRVLATNKVDSGKFYFTKNVTPIVL